MKESHPTWIVQKFVIGAKTWEDVDRIAQPPDNLSDEQIAKGLKEFIESLKAQGRFRTIQVTGDFDVYSSCNVEYKAILHSHIWPKG